MNLQAPLLNDSFAIQDVPGTFAACLNAHGLYNSFQFVLRLSPEVHRKIAEMPRGVSTGGQKFENLQAYSTYLHETVHWWQHIGSTSGFIQSLTFPVQTYMNYVHLKDLVKVIGPRKSILQYVLDGNQAGGEVDSPAGIANIIVNNFFDLEFFRLLSINPPRAKEVVENNFFESLGHSAYVTYSNTLNIIEKTFDEKTGCISNIGDLESQILELRKNRVQGYYYGSTLEVCQIGSLHIYEGQARFCQLQFLYFCSGEKLTWEDAANIGMLNGVYGVAFQCFLKLTGFSWPTSIDDPVVGLFLLVCDISINPSAGFPDEIKSAETFYKDIDPGKRFFAIARAIKSHCPELKTRIVNYSKEEYVEVSETICKYADLVSPHEISKKISQWPEISNSIRSLMEEQESFEYQLVNLPVRVLLSHFIKFMKDKHAKPEFFCWPGAWKVGDRVSAEVSELFDRQMALFLDKEEDGGVYPRIIPGKDPKRVKTMFDTFYATNVTYYMSRQWILSSGPFEYDYQWLSSKANHEEIKSFSDRHFESLYGLKPDDFKVY